MVKYYNGEMYTIPKEFEAEIRADERRKFAEWLEKKDLLTLWHGDDDYETLSAEKVLAMYEKEQKGESE